MEQKKKYTTIQDVSKEYLCKQIEIAGDDPFYELYMGVKHSIKDPKTHEIRERNCQKWIIDAMEEYFEAKDNNDKKGCVFAKESLKEALIQNNSRQSALELIRRGKITHKKEMEEFEQVIRDME